MMADNVSHPIHYNQGGVECIDAIKVATVGKTGIEAFCVGNVVKYIWRYEAKNGVEDAKKAAWYLAYLINELEAKEGNEHDCSKCAYFMYEFDKAPCSVCKHAKRQDSEEYKEYADFFSKAT